MSRNLSSGEEGLTLKHPQRSALELLRGAARFASRSIRYAVRRCIESLGAAIRIFGYDFFISYSRQDAGAYATALSRELAERGFKAFFDRSEFASGPSFRKRLRAGVRRSSALVLVVTPRAAESEHVAFEVNTFAATGRDIFPISGNPDFHPAAWVSIADRDFVWIDEAPERLAGGNPSASAIDTLQRSLKLKRVAAARLQALSATVATLALLLLAATYLWLDTLHKEKLLLARQLAAQSNVAFGEHPSLVQTSALLAIESLRIQDAPDGEAALRRASRMLARLQWARNDGEIVLLTRWSGDGRYLATVAGHSVVVSDAGGAERAKLSFDDQVNAIEFSPDGRYLAVGCESGSVDLFEAADWRRRSSFRHEAAVHAIAFGRGGDVVATAGEDRTIRLWDITGRREAALIRGPAAFQDVAFSPDMRYLATAAVDQTLRVWSTRLKRFVLIRPIATPPAGAYWFAMALRVQSVAFSPDGRYLATGGFNGSVRYLEVSTWRSVDLSRDASQAVYRVFFSSNGRWIAAQSQLAVTIWERPGLRQVAEYKSPDLIVTAAFSSDSRYLITGGADKTAHVWRTATWQEERRLVHLDTVRDARFSPAGELVATGSSDGYARVWKHSVPRVYRAPSDEETINAVSYSPDNRWLAIASTERGGVSPGALRILDARSLDELTRALPGENVRAAAFSRDGSRLAVATLAGRLFVFGTNPWRLLAQSDRSDAAQSLDFSSDGNHLVSGGDEGGLQVWDWARGAAARSFQIDYINCLRLSPDGALLAVGTGQFASGGQGAGFEVWRWGGEIERVHRQDTEESISAIAWSPDGKTLVTGDTAGALTVWNRPDWRRLGTIETHDVLRAIGFSGNGKWLASTGHDQTLVLWDAARWTQSARIPLADVGLDLAFDSKSDALAVATGGDVQLEWTHASDVVAEACGRVTRNLTTPEWRRFVGDTQCRATCEGIPTACDTPTGR